MTNSTLIWYTARASGIVALLLLSASVLLGLTMSTTILERYRRVAWRLDLHRFLSATAIVFLAIHVGSILLDTYVNFGLIEVIVPFTGSWHPVAVAWGIVAFYLLLAVEATSLLRARLSLRIWRWSHYLSFPLFCFSIVHAWTAGTDRHSLILRATYAATVAAVIALVAVRVAQSRRARSLDPATRRPTTELIP
jgi:predicted ferric reductase